MIEGVIIKKINKNSDNRGWLAEIFRNDEGEFKPAMSYVSITKPGFIRGPHEHREQSDFFIFLGPGNFELYLWDNREKSNTFKQHEKIIVGEDNPTSVIVPPGIIHGYKCISDKDSYCINLPNKLYRGEGKKEEIDEIRWEEKEDCPYKIN